MTKLKVLSGSYVLPINMIDVISGVVSSEYNLLRGDSKEIKWIHNCKRVGERLPGCSGGKKPRAFLAAVYPIIFEQALMFLSHYRVFIVLYNE